MSDGLKSLAPPRTYGPYLWGMGLATPLLVIGVLIGWFIGDVYRLEAKVEALPSSTLPKPLTATVNNYGMQSDGLFWVDLTGNSVELCEHRYITRWIKNSIDGTTVEIFPVDTRGGNSVGRRIFDSHRPVGTFDVSYGYKPIPGVVGIIYSTVVPTGCPSGFQGSYQLYDPVPVDWTGITP